MAEMDDLDDGLIHDEIEIEDFEFDALTDTFTYPCPCGDEFTVTRVSNTLYRFPLSCRLNEKSRD